MEDRIKTLPPPSSWSRIYLIHILLVAVILSPRFVCARDQSALAWPSAPLPPRISYEKEFSSAHELGIKDSAFRKFLRFVFGSDGNEGIIVQPINIHKDAEGKLYVVDVAMRAVHIFDIHGNQYHQINNAGHQDLRSPVDVEVSPNGSIYISDSELGAVFVFDSSHKYQFTIKGYFTRPTGLAWKDDKLYVVDTGMHKILVFNKDGVLLNEIGRRGIGTGEFNYPISMTARDQMYVNDALNFRIQTINTKSGLATAFGKQGDAQGTLNRSKGIAVDSENNIYVSDALFNVFQIFNSAGQLLLVVGSPGRNPGEFQMPNGIHIDAQDQIYVCDSLNGRIQIFQYHKVAEK